MKKKFLFIFIILFFFLYTNVYADITLNTCSSGGITRTVSGHSCRFITSGESDLQICCTGITLKYGSVNIEKSEVFGSYFVTAINKNDLTKLNTIIINDNGSFYPGVSEDDATDYLADLYAEEMQESDTGSSGESSSAYECLKNSFLKTYNISSLGSKGTFSYNGNTGYFCKREGVVNNAGTVDTSSDVETDRVGYENRGDAGYTYACGIIAFTNTNAPVYKCSFYDDTNKTCIDDVKTTNGASVTAAWNTVSKQTCTLSASCTIDSSGSKKCTLIDTGVDTSVKIDNSSTAIKDYISKADDVNANDILNSTLDCKSLLGSTTNPDDVAYFLNMFLQIIKYASLIILVVFTILDYFKAMSDLKGYAKANKNLLIRLILIILLFVGKVLIDKVLEMFGIINNCGI